MPDGSDSLAVQVVGRIAEVPAAEWDACAGDNPFVSHAFLSALEDSGSVSAETGWLPQHLLLPGLDGAPGGGLLGCAPLYLKSHSYGEYVFDWNWADAYERAGGRYYPKLQCSVPFTPATGPRLLANPAANRDEVEAGLVAAMLELARRHQASSLHITFPPKEQYERLGAFGLLQRLGVQYHWQNAGYADFDAFLAALASRKRKAIRKERRKVAESGIHLRALTGDEIEPRHWDAFFEFYMVTADRKWGQPYLTREFFHLLGERLADRVVLVMADYRGEPVAGALNLKSGDTLYGRNWGSLGRFRFLHFETCYYQAIDYAIAHGLKFVEAGAQGEHKIQRGYLPTPTYSAHWIADAGFSRAVEEFLARERRAMQREIDALEDYSPFKEGCAE
ncbi:MAG: GNAT family N-acetyltransferase [Kiloniellaceae bacterium]